MPIRRPRPKTGLVLQDHGLLPWATVRENVRLGFRIRKFYGHDERHTPLDAHIDGDTTGRIVDYWLDRLGIEGDVGKATQEFETALGGTSHPLSAGDLWTVFSLDSQ